ncbi:MAG: cation:proton antiporter, partial [Pseudomonadota bacterium]|nr:cation:proton antiporter [Pseudomonadota bacterium]
MQDAVSPSSLRDLLLFLAAAGVIVPLFYRLRVSPVLGFLAAGVLLGPFGLGSLAGDIPIAGFLTISDPEEIGVIAELGVVLLLFMIGLELSLERLKRLRRFIIGLGGLQVGVTGAVIAAVGGLLGLPAQAAIVLGLALALSSTAIVMPVLAQREEQQTPSGRLSFAVLLAQDLALVPILFGISALSGRGEAGFVSELLGRFVPVAVVFGLLLASGPLILRPLLKAAAKARTRELFVAACLLVVLVTGLVAQAAGLSMALGAFIAGLLLAETEYQREIEVTLDPFKGLFLGAFFLAVGIELDLGLVAREPLLIGAAAVALIVGKAALIFGLARLFGAPVRVALQTGLVLGAGGEFAFVILEAAAGVDLIAPRLRELAIVTATLTMFTIPLLAWAGERIGRAAEARDAEGDSSGILAEPGTAADVVIVGFGRVGQLVAEMLARHGKSFLVIDADPSIVSQHRRQGASILFGDASRRDFLERISLSDAQALVVTLPNAAATEAVVTAAREIRSDLTLVVREPLLIGAAAVALIVGKAALIFG